MKKHVGKVVEKVVKKVVKKFVKKVVKKVVRKVGKNFWKKVGTDSAKCGAANCEWTMRDQCSFAAGRQWCSIVRRINQSINQLLM